MAKDLLGFRSVLWLGVKEQAGYGKQPLLGAALVIQHILPRGEDQKNQEPIATDPS